MGPKKGRPRGSEASAPPAKPRRSTASIRKDGEKTESHANPNAIQVLDDITMPITPMTQNVSRWLEVKDSFTVDDEVHFTPADLSPASFMTLPIILDGSSSLSR